MRTKLLLVFVLTSTNLFCQLNKKLFLGYRVSIFSNMIIADSALFVSGLSITLPPQVWGGFLGKISLQGDSLFQKKIDFDEELLWWQNDMVLLKDGSFLIAASAQFKEVLLKLSQEGQISKFVPFHSYFDPLNAQLYTETLFEDADSTIWAIGVCRKSIVQDYIQITKFNSNLDSLSKVAIGNVVYPKRPTRFTKLGANKYLIAGYFSNEYQLNKDFRMGDFLIEVDSSCKVLSEYYTPATYKLGGMGDMLYEQQDSSYVAFGSDAYEIKDFTGQFGFVYYYPMVYKLTKNKQIAWKTKMGNGIYSQGNRALRIMKSNEKDGYVFAGQLYDTIRGNKIDDFGTLGKVSLTGDSLWLRKYRLFEDTTRFISGEIYEIQPSPDGGYYLAGSTIGGPQLEDGYQGGWLLKVDQYGCLVPGCQLPNSLPVIEAIDLHYKVFPNPAQADLNIFVGDTKGTDLTIRFCDALGVPLKSLQHRGAATTYILPLQSYASGTYIVQFWQEGRLVKGEKVVLAR